MPDTSEQERLKRIRDQQIAARNPRVKEAKFSNTMNQRNKKLQRKVSVGSVWNDIPNKVRSAGFGILLGIILLLIVPNYWDSTWALPVMFVVTILFGAIGFMIGNALDVRDRLRDYSKH